MPSFERALRRVDEPEIDDLHAGSLQLVGNDLHIAFESALQPLELTPVSIQTDTEKTHA